MGSGFADGMRRVGSVYSVAFLAKANPARANWISVAGRNHPSGAVVGWVCNPIDDFKLAAIDDSPSGSALAFAFDRCIADVFEHCREACEVVKSELPDVAEFNKAVGKLLISGRLIAHLHRLNKLVQSTQPSLTPSVPPHKPHSSALN